MKILIKESAFIRILEQYKDDNFDIITSPSGVNYQVPKGTKILSTLKNVNTKIKEWALPSKGGTGNEQTAAWLPDSWESVFPGATKAPFEFKTPDGNIYRASIQHPTINKIGENVTRDVFYRRLYALDPEPNGWKFYGYYSKTGKKFNPIKGGNGKQTYCKAKVDSVKSRARQYWLSKLADPEVKSKFDKNWEEAYNSSESGLISSMVSIWGFLNNLLGPDTKHLSNSVFPKYINIIKKIPISTYTPKDEPESADAIARFNPVKNDIRYNCDYINSTDDSIVETLVHELQHALYDYKPFNPPDQILEKFNGIENPMNTISDILNMKTPSYAKRSGKRNLISKILNVDNSDLDIDVLKKWERLAITNVKNDSDPEYSCRPTEKQSNLEALRKKLNKQNLTKEDLLPYVKFQKYNENADYLLICWALGGFKSLDSFIKGLNDLAKNKPNNNNQSYT
jgi:hypothetical protein